MNRSAVARMPRGHALLVCAVAMMAAVMLVGVCAQDALERLDLVTAGGTHQFAVEVMRTDAQRERGLMFRRFLPQDRGMLFDFETPQPVMMWMKNTILPLDMIFIGKDGRVISIAQNTEPMSERIIPSGGDVLGVLEVNAGTAQKIGLKKGDKVIHPLFGD